MKDFASYGGTDGIMKEAKQYLASLGGKSENDVIREIYAKAEAGKRAGTLTNEQIDAFYDRFSQLLDAGRRKKLKKIVERLKSM